MNATDIRSRDDRKLFELLSKNEDVIQVNQAIERAEQEGHQSTRRRLLATSVRLSPSMSPAIHEMTRQCMECLGMEISLELYVYNSPQFNAMCVKPEDGRLFIMFSSSLLEAFPENELMFVIGHELGHHLYRHHDIPVGYMLSGPRRAGPKLALQLFAWSRYAEISADRAGAHCSEDFETVGRALFRLASGLSDRLIHFDLEEFVGQAVDMQTEDAQPGQGSPREDWFSTHPFSPLRVKALELYYQSEFVTDGGLPPEELELGVQRVMALMEPSYLEGRTPAAEAMRRLLFAGSIALANSNQDISEAEIKTFEEFFGAGSFSEKLDVAKLEEDLHNRIDQVKAQVSLSKRMQVVHDLSIIALADNRASAKERALLVDIARGLGIEETFVDSCLESSAELD